MNERIAKVLAEVMEISELDALIDSTPECAPERAIYDLALQIALDVIGDDMDSA